MEFDEEPSPWELEKLLNAWAEDDDPLQDDQQDVIIFSKFRSTGIDLDTESFSSHLRCLLSAVPEDDPLKSSIQSELCLPWLKDEPFMIQEIPGKGQGVIASRRIPAGSIVLDDPFVLSIQEPSRTPTTEDDANHLLKLVLLQLLDQYTQLPIEARRQLASLHGHIKPGTSDWFYSVLRTAGVDITESELEFIIRLYCIFNTNEFLKVAPGKSWTWRIRRLFLTTSRINHSCRPNTRSTQTTEGHKVVTAIRDIEPGEELTLKYLDHFPYSRREWEEVTERSWGFICNCPDCRWKVDSQ
ncbi:putative protein lysine methyltransferase SET5 [Cytospora mali]|uniref:SET domain-containing protein n=1 Tax=Cytospora mali TaxID=578113 RepID=A0A194UNL2_CYTMA|nr:putative protein lysine methyltransferase SET5 [Valsa mali var. pyri (nom. inval.)]